MKLQVIIATFSFVFGVTIGSLALGRKPNASSFEEIQKPLSHDLVQATATESNPDSHNSLMMYKDKSTYNEKATKISVGNQSNKAEPISESQQISSFTARWTNHENQIGQLERRIHSLEQQLADIKTEQQNGKKEQNDENTPTVLPVATPEDRRFALMAAGVTHTDAEDIVWRQSELELERLELKDQAMREGWYRTDQYNEALKAFDQNSVDLRTEIGEQSYDEYLYQTGEFNRVKITSVIQGSAAEQTGLIPGDIIESYGNKRIFGYSDLLNATADGERGEKVPVVIRRDEVVIEADVARGPMGVRIEAFTAPPNG